MRATAWIMFSARSSGGLRFFSVALHMNHRSRSSYVVPQFSMAPDFRFSLTPVGLWAGPLPWTRRTEFAKGQSTRSKSHEQSHEVASCSGLSTAHGLQSQTSQTDT